ncbi:DNA translocase FtsK [Staphylococcus chromogenes]|uniref:DNA translocase FtsK n=1 Tax=Staphylococcus chromogenes TaxID=46126 RepID=UPI002DB5C624|nr:DNA translocase FtsK [Staphylococcus chromogenes]MEB7823497.1 FtsK/SpoIIIE domain-containing protein [Staphylococcus chromogenes]
MSWFDKLFGEDEPSDQTSFNKKRSTVRKSENRSLIPQSNDIYQRPKGKFRFPIAMDGQSDSFQQTERSEQKQHRHATRPHSGLHVDRKTRRHRGQRSNSTPYSSQQEREVKEKNTTNYQRNKAVHTSLSHQDHTRRRETNSNVHNSYKNKYKSQESRYHHSQNATSPHSKTFLHQEFKASEVPSAIFGTQERKTIQNSGLNQPPGARSKQAQQPSNNRTSSQVKIPSHSKRDNTVNIENIYASQIVDEIRKEREKKVLQKKRFKEALQHKKTSHHTEEQSSIQKAIDEMYASQARHLLGDDYHSAYEEKEHVDLVATAQDKDSHANLTENQTPHDASIEYEEIDLNQIDASSHTFEKDINENEEHIAQEDNLSDEITSNNTSQAPGQDLTAKAINNDKPHQQAEEFYDFDENEDTNDQNENELMDKPQNHSEPPQLAQHEVAPMTSQTETLQPDSLQHSDEVEEDTQRLDKHYDEHDERVAETSAIVDVPQLTPTEAVEDNEKDVNQSFKEDLQERLDEQDISEAKEVKISEPPLKPNLHDSEKTNEHEVKRPIRKGSKPFNVVMTPSDKKRMMERQKTSTIMNEQQRTSPSSTPNIQVTNDNNHQPREATFKTEQNNHQVHLPSSKDVAEDADSTKKIRRGPVLHLPSIDLLDQPEVQESDNAWIEDKKQQLNDAFYYFNVPAEVVNVIEGPSVTRFELSVERGVKVSRITALQDDIKMALAAKDIRIEAPIPGTSLVGIEVPNQHPTKVNLRSILETEAFKNAESKLTVAMGNRINNEPLLMDIAKTPHALIAGATGSGKSVSINSILLSLLYRNHPEELKLLLIDPKMVELAPYNDLPHLVAPVITDVKAATQSLKWAVEEMERRYKLFAQTHVRNITAFNKKVNYDQRMPKIVIVIDELADLMMMAPQEVEQSIARIAQKARACGIHMLVATQRPSVNVITGLIKANIPTRIAFMVSSSVDSRTILDSGGAERLLGYGDMLYLGGGMNKPIRVQGTFVSDEEIDEVVDYIKSQREPEYLFQEKELLKKTEEPAKDELFNEVCEFMVKERHISTSLIQRHFQIGYNRAARIIDQLEQLGYVSGANGSKPRDVYLTEADLHDS